jgi:hypothetical protein
VPLARRLILEIRSNLVLNVADRHQAYREGAQKYAKEEEQIWEDLRHGIFLGTKKFVQKIKKRYLPDIPNGEIPRQRQLSKSLDADALLIQAAKILNCKLEQFRKAARVSQSEILDQDMLLYLMWQSGQLTNYQIAVSRRVGVFKKMIKFPSYTSSILLENTY